MLTAKKVAEARLEFTDFGTHDVLAMVQHRRDPLIDDGTDAFLLALQVDKIHGKIGERGRLVFAASLRPWASSATDFPVRKTAP